MTNKKLKSIVKEFLSEDENSSTIGSKYKNTFLDKRQEFINQMMSNKHELVKRYGKDAEKVIVGRAVKDAKNYIDKMKQQDLKELVRKTLMQEEPVKEDIDLGHEDNEPHMIKGELYQIGKYAMELYAMLEEYDEMNQEVDFPAWWQAKITTAKNMMSGAKHYLEFEIKEPAIDAAVDAMTGEEPHEGEPEAHMMNEDEGAVLDQVRNKLLGLFQPYGDFQILDMTMKGQNTGKNFRLRAKSKGADWKGLENFMRNNPDFTIKHISKQTFDNPKSIDFSYKTSIMNEKHLTKAEKEKKEEIVKAMKKDFKGPKPALYAIATKKAIDIAEIAKKIKEERFKKGADIGKKGPGFEETEKSAEKKYGSEEAGKRVAGAILKKVLAKKGKK